MRACERGQWLGGIYGEEQYPSERCFEQTRQISSNMAQWGIGAGETAFIKVA